MVRIVIAAVCVVVLVVVDGPNMVALAKGSLEAAVCAVLVEALGL